jgi:peroxisomal 3,2-trans-enoyl-CoA isomerase
MVNRIFPKETFMKDAVAFLEEQLAVNDGGSMMESKRLINAPLRDARMLAVYNAMDALAERFVSGAPVKRFEEKRKLLEGEFSVFGARVFGGGADVGFVQLNRRIGRRSEGS